MPMERREGRDVAQRQSTPAICTDGWFKGYDRLHWIHSAVKRDPELRCMNLMHHINPHNLRRAFSGLDGSKATGIDHVSKSDYEKNLEQNLLELNDAIKRGGWRPQPSREVLIPKPQGGMRPLAIGCLEDKIVQNLTAKILMALYEPEFYPNSYGFRPGKSAHQAIGHLYRAISHRHRGCVVVEMDIEKFFNSVNQTWLMERIKLKVGDPHFLRLIKRLLRNSVLHSDGTIKENRCGTPQGSPVSPVLANICLHELLDTWFSQNYGHDGEMIRYADDAVFVFKDMQTARQFQEALQERVKEAGLQLNVEKSGLMQFDATNPAGTIGFLGFELYWGRDLRHQKTLKLKTASKKFSQTVTAFGQWVKDARNVLPTVKLWKIAASKLRGHYNYFGLVFNQCRIAHFYRLCIDALFKWLNRRSQKRSYTWEQFQHRLRYLPLPRPPLARELLDITTNSGTEHKHKPKSRMRKSRTYGSVRSLGFTPRFT